MPRKPLTIAAVLVVLVAPWATACGGVSVAQETVPVASPVATPPPLPPNPSLSGSVDVALADTPPMVALRDLVEDGAFADVYPNVEVNLTLLPAAEAGRTIAAEVAGRSGRFDVVAVGNDEVPVWASQGWLAEVGAAAADPAYGFDDLVPSVVAGLSDGGRPYALPFSAEGAMIFYRTDLFDDARLAMPARPTWDEVAEFAAELHDPDAGVFGVCLRGRPDWDEGMASLTTVINAFGGRWYDEAWAAQLDGGESAAAIRFYVETLQDYGPPGSERNGGGELERLFVEGRCAQWYDVTAVAPRLTDPTGNPDYHDDVGFAHAPSAELPSGSWLWSWNLAMPADADAKEAALAFMTWATSRQYVAEVVEADGGWGRAPTGARRSVFADPGYRAWAAGSADVVRDAIAEATPTRPTEEPVPYVGGQFVAIPAFRPLANDVGQEIAAALVGQQSVGDAIEAANDLADRVARDAGYQTAPAPAEPRSTMGRWQAGAGAIAPRAHAPPPEGRTVRAVIIERSGAARGEDVPGPGEATPPGAAARAREGA